MKFNHILIVGIFFCFGLLVLGFGSLIQVIQASAYKLGFPISGIAGFALISLLGAYGIAALLFYVSQSGIFYSFLQGRNTHDLGFTSYQAQKQFEVRDWATLNEAALKDIRVIKIKLGEKVDSLIEEKSPSEIQNIAEEKVSAFERETEGKKRELGEIPTNFNHAVLKASEKTDLMESMKKRTPKKVLI